MPCVQRGFDFRNGAKTRCHSSHQHVIPIDHNLEYLSELLRLIESISVGLSIASGCVVSIESPNRHLVLPHHCTGSVMNTLVLVIACLLACASLIDAWSLPLRQPKTTPMTGQSTTTALSMNNPYNNNDFLRWAKDKRSADADDNVVELNRPLGLILNQDDSGNVYVETVAPNGNAARTGKVS